MLAVLRVMLIAGAASLALACQAPPNVRPFADATAELYTTVAAAGTRTVEVLRSTADPEDSASVAAADANAQAFAAQWARRVAAMQAMSVYADELAAVVDAGENGREAAQGAMTAMSNLLEDLQVPAPAGQAVDALTQTATVLFEQWARHQAAQAIEEAVVAAQPYVRQAADEIGRSLGLLLPILDAARKDALTAVMADPDYQLDAGFLAGLDELRRERRQQLLSALAAQDAPAAAAARADLEALELLYEQEAARDSHARAQRELAEIETRFTALERLVVQAQSTVTVWASAHLQIADAAKNRKSIELRQLVLTVDELSRIYEEARQ